MRAVKILTDSRAGVRLKASRVTVSTVGLVPAIERFCTDPENGASLAISLHTVSDEVRDQVQTKQGGGGAICFALRLNFSLSTLTITGLLELSYCDLFTVLR